MEIVLNNKINTLHLITDTETQSRFSHMQLAAEALAAGVKVVQYRRKSGSTRDMVREARAMLELCNQHQALLIINDHLDVALACGAHGLHLGQDDLPLPVARQHMGKGAILGASVNNVEQLLTAKQESADYVG